MIQAFSSFFCQQQQLFVDASKLGSYFVSLSTQAQALLTKNLLYQSLDSCLHRLASCTPAVYGFLPRSVESAGGTDGASEVVAAAQRDAAVTNLRFLNIFCNFHHDTFAHAVQLLDLVLGRVKVIAQRSSADICQL